MRRSIIAFLILILLISACAPGRPPSVAAVKIYIEEDGIYRVTAIALRGAGLDLGDTPRMIQLTNRGREVPFRVVGQGKAMAIEFYGLANKGKYSKANVYWLALGQAGRRMAERKAPLGDTLAFPGSFATTLHFEEDLLHRPKVPEGADHWHWRSLTAPSSAAFAFSLPHPAADDGVLRVSLLGGTSSPVRPDHHVRILLNDRLVADATWDGQEGDLVEAAIPRSYLLEGANILLVEAPGDTGAKADIVLFDWFELDYRRRFVAEGDCLEFEGQAGTYRLAGFSQRDVEIFDITYPHSVAHLSGHSVERRSDGYAVFFSDNAAGRRRYLAVSSKAIKDPARIAPASPTDLRAPDRQADYIVITYPDFRQSLQPLVEWRQAQGLRVAVATIDQIYDEFSHGLADPTAIRDFLRYAHEHWAKPAPRYVLLVGDASYDYRDNLKAPHKNLVPTYLLDTHFVGETASDNWFVRLDDDGLPDMAIGRLPAKSAAEVKAIVDKIISYERSSTSGGWRKRVLLVADDDDPAFESISNDLARDCLASDYQAIKVYLNAFADPEESRARIIEEINDGSLIISYIGHAALDVWAKERVFASEDIASLHNGEKLPFVVTMTCLDGYFHHPEADCLAEELLLAEGKGAIACFAPTSESLPSDQDVLVKALFQALFADDIPTLGEAIVRAKRSLPERGRGYEDLIETYTLLGDPALRLKWPPQMSANTASGCRPPWPGGRRSGRRGG
ncbi:MAG TPA: hypothetical protein EYP55_04210 [Anaerolineae bacterium]|nr:hypothetical protein [Anaerolineae bacterium]